MPTLSKPLEALPAPLRAPALWVQMREQGVMYELGALVAASPILRLLGRGDHHPVFVMPGFLGDDSSTLPLRFHLRSWGYWAHGMHGGQNMGPTPEVLASIDDRLVKLFGRHERKVSLVGWSAGGQYARYLAHRHPEIVRQVITLGTPIQLHPQDRSSFSFMSDRLDHRFDPDFRRLTEHERGPLPVPSTAIYSRTDGVVRWEACIDDVDEQHDNVEIRGTHSGMGFNPAALFVVADRLHQPEGDWRPFHAPAWLRALYPRPESWQHLHRRDVDQAATMTPLPTVEPTDPIERLRAIAARERGDA